MASFAGYLSDRILKDQADEHRWTPQVFRDGAIRTLNPIIKILLS
jgi:hypothetical protein